MSETHDATSLAKQLRRVSSPFHTQSFDFGNAVRLVGCSFLRGGQSCMLRAILPAMFETCDMPPWGILQFVDVDVDVDVASCVF